MPGRLTFRDHEIINRYRLRPPRLWSLTMRQQNTNIVRKEKTKQVQVTNDQLDDFVQNAGKPPFHPATLLLKVSDAEKGNTKYSPCSETRNGSRPPGLGPTGRRRSVLTGVPGGARLSGRPRSSKRGASQAAFVRWGRAGWRPP